MLILLSSPRRALRQSRRRSPRVYALLLTCTCADDVCGCDAAGQRRNFSHWRLVYNDIHAVNGSTHDDTDSFTPIYCKFLTSLNSGDVGLRQYLSNHITCLVAFDIHGPIRNHVTTSALTPDGWFVYYYERSSQEPI